MSWRTVSHAQFGEVVCIVSRRAILSVFADSGDRSSVGISGTDRDAGLRGVVSVELRVSGASCDAHMGGIVSIVQLRSWALSDATLGVVVSIRTGGAYLHAEPGYVFSPFLGSYVAVVHASLVRGLAEVVRSSRTNRYTVPSRVVRVLMSRADWRAGPKDSVSVGSIGGSCIGTDGHAGPGEGVCVVLSGGSPGAKRDAGVREPVSEVVGRDRAVRHAATGGVVCEPPNGTGKNALTESPIHEEVGGRH